MAKMAAANIYEKKYVYIFALNSFEHMSISRTTGLQGNFI